MHSSILGIKLESMQAPPPLAQLPLRAHFFPDTDLCKCKSSLWVTLSTGFTILVLNVIPTQLNK